MKHTLDELKKWQALPLKEKIELTQMRIAQWYRYYDGDVYVSFSGGKDSTVLLDICRKMYPYIDAVHVNTGLEYPEVERFVSGTDNVTVIKPKKTFRDVVYEYGYPLVSKEVSGCVAVARKYLTSIMENNEDYKNIKMGSLPSLPNDAPVRAKMFFGEYMHKEKGIETNEVSFRYDKTRYRFMLDAPFEISSMCCNVMKKKPMHTFQRESHMMPITAQMASESLQRTQIWIQKGCNAFDSKNPISNPMSFWTEQDVLLYIYENELPIAPVYGKVVEYAGQGQVENQMNLSEFGVFDLERPLLKTTGCGRTGCFACGYGMHLEKPCECRIQKTIDFSNPKLADWQLRGGAFSEDGMWRPKGGMGYWFVLKWMNVHGGMHYTIPNEEYYVEKYSTEETRRYLEVKE